MSKYLSGLMPVNFKISGKILIILGALILIAKLVSGITKTFEVHDYLIYFSIAIIMIGAFLIIVPKKQ